MRIGILTFHRAHNYGAVLQCYALQEILKGKGHDVQVIDYHQPWIEDQYDLLSWNMFKRNTGSVSQLFKYVKGNLKKWMLAPEKAKNFRDFREQFLNLSLPCMDVMPQGYDCYVIGSDQLWSLHCLGGEQDKMYLGGFDRPAGSRLVGVVGSDMGENAKNTIMTTQGEIQYEALLNSYVTALDQCLQGLISPSTLGIDTKKLDNAEAQREKEKTTLYRRNQIVEVLEETLKDIVDITFKVLDNMNGLAPTDTEATITFGGYANPSFEAQVETVGKASTSSIMSVEAQVEELWGDTKEEEWKIEEVKRIKFERGIEVVEEPAINQDIDLIEQEVKEEGVDETNDNINS